MKPEIASNGRTVWVNGPVCIGRFCPLSGEVLVEHRLVSMEPDWNAWCKGMLEAWGVKVTNKWKPEWLSK